MSKLEAFRRMIEQAALSTVYNHERDTYRIGMVSKVYQLSLLLTNNDIDELDDDFLYAHAHEFVNFVLSNSFGLSWLSDNFKERKIQWDGESNA